MKVALFRPDLHTGKPPRERRSGEGRSQRHRQAALRQQPRPGPACSDTADSDAREPSAPQAGLRGADRPRYRSSLEVVQGDQRDAEREDRAGRRSVDRRCGAEAAAARHERPNAPRNGVRHSSGKGRHRRRFGLRGKANFDADDRCDAHADGSAVNPRKVSGADAQHAGVGSDPGCRPSGAGASRSSTSEDSGRDPPGPQDSNSDPRPCRTGSTERVTHR
jgi:hypothetical protein